MVRRASLSKWKWNKIILKKSEAKNIITTLKIRFWQIYAGFNKFRHATKNLTFNFPSFDTGFSMFRSSCTTNCLMYHYCTSWTYHMKYPESQFLPSEVLKTKTFIIFLEIASDYFYIDPKFFILDWHCFINPLLLKTFKINDLY